MKQDLKAKMVDGYLARSKQWREAQSALRDICLDSPLTEDFKWGHPCYTLDNTNLLILQGFKHFCALLIVNGSLLEDPEGLLRQPGKNTQAARRLEFTSVDEVHEREPLIRRYIQASIDAEKAGLKVEFKKTEEFDYPEELITKLDEVPGLKDAFDALTPGRQRAYLLHFSGAKQSKTRVSRIEKSLEAIFNGKGPNDR
ncbi:YdeI/OmpD-associated family protein [Saccharospirillum salsuginis]|uniref:YdhG-like domain-containing protein n=1 Tax=Saccharospirillum salsuginis TaxID=418750 RepID=A0A918K5A3_9GAMM|nr:YdeI/OmpD-associated family protein [Saccharospirillum salsuginis]GGX48810.1 hypothetical protein GCM10007392_14980 [Saccharospirillum salsuginis]